MYRRQQGRFSIYQPRSEVEERPQDLAEGKRQLQPNLANLQVY